MLKFLITLQLVLLLLINGGALVFGQSLKPANIFGDHMVLQRGKTVPVWGHSSPKDKITVTFASQKKTTRAAADGKWMVRLDPLEASATGRDLIISGKSQVVIKDVLVGEVWICSGQSNMQMGVSSSPEVRGLVPLAKNIRSFHVQNLVALEEQEEVQGQWEATHPESAVAFSFAYFLNNLAEVPVGIIQASWGSSSIEAWMPRSMVEELPHFDTIMNEFDSDGLRVTQIKKLIGQSDTWTNKENIFLRRQPNILYNAMMYPLIPFACRGLVWYQGERNTRYISGMPEVDDTNWFHRVCGMKDYEDVLKKWILTYRKQWQDDEMHFMVIMLPGYGKGTEAKKVIDPESPTEPSWAWMRESQLASLDLPHTSVVNTIDLGDLKNIHPNDKLPIGQRGALLAARNTLNQDIPSMGPVFKSVDLQGNKLVVHFDHANGLKTINGKAPSGFWISDDSREWVLAEAAIEGERVILSSPKVKEPKYIRFAFAGKPSVNLVNESELPAYPFRTDSWQE
ncbi:sialate O-acetylesterase [Flammeovirgaceae bacterium SG7u.111]|nr:sialate O-acetylesterase [Flammeovirgaceae bacterium SG7u.132]WPO37935.1 sialate O-acetylesterase [Flammeovirgaceae bacterium SG7u.111]